MDPTKVAPWDTTHILPDSAEDLRGLVEVAWRAIILDGQIWVSRPRKAIKMSKDIIEDIVREIALPFGLVGIKVCAVTAVWSGLKLAIRKELLGKQR